MPFEPVASAIAGVPFMSPAQGRIVYDHVVATRPAAVLELGTAHGVGAAYLAAALADNGHGHLTTVDFAGAAYDPAPEAVLARAGVAGRVTVVREFSSYTWWLKEQVAAASDAHGNVTPRFDFVYLDGAKNWTIDGLAVVLVEKLLRPGGWLLMDDLDWTYADDPGRAATDGVANRDLSEPERTEPHLRAVFDLIVAQHPSFTELRVQDEWWGWARKAPGEPRRRTVETTRPLGALAAGGGAARGARRPAPGAPGARPGARLSRDRVLGCPNNPTPAVGDPHMGRHTGPVERLSRREGVELYLKGERALNGKSALAGAARLPPGQHGQRRQPRPSIYATQLRQKQRLKRYYGVRERQLRRYVREAARRREGRMGDHLLMLLERRLDNVVYRLGFAATRAQARQFVTHGHVLVDGRKVDIPSYSLRPGPAGRDPRRQPGRPRRPGRARPQRAHARLARGRRRGAGGPRAARAGAQRDPDAGRGAAHRRVLRAPVTEFARLAATPCTDHAALGVLLARELGRAGRRLGRRPPDGARPRAARRAATRRPSCTRSASCSRAACARAPPACCCCPTCSPRDAGHPAAVASPAPGSRRAPGSPSGSSATGAASTSRTRSSTARSWSTRRARTG